MMKVVRDYLNDNGRRKDGGSSGCPWWIPPVVWLARVVQRVGRR